MFADFFLPTGALMKDPVRPRIFAVPRPMIRPSVSTILLLLLILTACADSTGPKDLAPESQDLIFFVSDAGSAIGGAGETLSDIYVVRGDGSDVRNLTNAPAPVYRELRLSPDASTLAFESDRELCYNVWVMKVDGTDPVRLTGDPFERCNEMPRWSRDGSRIAFTTSRETIDRSWEVYVMSSDGTGPHNVSDNAGSQATGWDFPLGWSPDGKVVFDHVTTGGVATFTVSPDGSSLGPLQTLTGGYAPFWSPNGGKVAFMTGQVGNEGISIMNADGTGLLVLSGAGGGDSFNPGYRANSYHNPWSPDGSRLAFMSERDGNSEVYVMTAEGAEVVNVSNDPAADRFDGWSPDGASLVFSSERRGNWDIYVVNRDGTGLRRLTDGPARDWGAVWVDGG